MQLLKLGHFTLIAGDVALLIAACYASLLLFGRRRSYPFAWILLMWVAPRWLFIDLIVVIGQPDEDRRTSTRKPPRVAVARAFISRWSGLPTCADRAASRRRSSAMQLRRRGSSLDGRLAQSVSRLICPAATRARRSCDASFATKRAIETRAPPPDTVELTPTEASLPTRCRWRRSSASTSGQPLRSCSGSHVREATDACHETTLGLRARKGCVPRRRTNSPESDNRHCVSGLDCMLVAGAHMRTDLRVEA